MPRSTWMCESGVVGSSDPTISTGRGVAGTEKTLDKPKTKLPEFLSLNTHFGSTNKSAITGNSTMLHRS